MSRDWKIDNVMGEQYRITQKLGEGSMGVVWRCMDFQANGKDVAVKVLHPRYANAPDEIQRVKENYGLVSDLIHQNIAAYRTLQKDNESEEYLLVMEYVQGKSLEEWMNTLRHKKSDFRIILDVLWQMAKGLDFAHGRDIVHRDIKPANVKITDSGTVKILDFGLATEARRRWWFDMGNGDIAGTRAYKAPEQWEGSGVTGASDQYALAVVAYEMLAGTVPFYDNNVEELEKQVLNISPAKIKWVSSAINDVLRKGLAKTPQERYGSCLEFVRALEKAMKTNSPVRKIAMFVSFLLLGTGVCAYLLVYFIFLDFINMNIDNIKKDYQKRKEKIEKLEISGGRWKKLKEIPVFKCHWDKLETLEAQDESWSDYLLGIVSKLKYSACMRECDAIGKTYDLWQVKSKKLAEVSERRKDLSEAMGNTLAYVSFQEAERYYDAAEKALDNGQFADFEQFLAEAAKRFEKAEAELKARTLERCKTFFQELVGLEEWDKAKKCLVEFGEAGFSSEAEALNTTLEEARKASLKQLLEEAKVAKKDGLWETVNFRAMGALEIDADNGEAKALLDERNRLMPPPKADPPKADPPKAAPPKEDVPKEDVPKEDVPKEDVPKEDVPKEDVPKEDVPKEDVPKEDVPKEDVPKEDVPKEDVPKEDVPKADRVVLLPGNVSLAMMKISAGEFLMGSPQNEAGRDDDEAQRTVSLTKDFWLGCYEVTYGQWKAVMGTTLLEQSKKRLQDTTRYPDLDNKTYPEYYKLDVNKPDRYLGNQEDSVAMYLVSWTEAMEFCHRLNGIAAAKGELPDGYEYTLPTEAQWEYACRAGTKTALYNGPIVIKGKHNAPDLDAIAWYGGNSNVDYAGIGWTCSEWEERQYPGDSAGIRSVGKREPNAWGLYDMLGNVGEWCRDWFNKYDCGGQVDPLGPPEGGIKRSVRGGSWSSEAHCCRSAYRICFYPSWRFNHVGFRVALTAMPKESTPTAALPGGVSLSLVKIKAGTFMMGSPEDEPGRSDDEVRHKVTLTRDFWLGKYEVTHQQWKAVMGRDLRSQVRRLLADDTRYDFLDNKTYREYWSLERNSDPMARIGSEDDQVAMYYVTWAEAMEFCSRLTEFERKANRLPNGYVYSLPTEAQWEYACRAGTDTALYNGPIVIKGENDAPALDRIAWYGGNSSQGYEGRGWNTETWPGKQYKGGYAGPRLIGTRNPNSWGLYDMLGNVGEWCLDNAVGIGSEAVTDPVYVVSGNKLKVTRGGGWNIGCARVRSAERLFDSPNAALNVLGFRVALIPEMVR